MGQPAAKQGDQIVGMDTHIIMMPTPGGSVPTPVSSHKFNGLLNGNLSSNVNIMGCAAAVVGSTADNVPQHTPQGGPFQKEPTNKGQITMGSTTVMINKQAAARNGDPALTCNDPVDMPVGKVIATGTVMIG